jgi:TonB family protein
VLVVGVSRSPVLPSALGPLPRTPSYSEHPDDLPLPRRILLPPFPPQARFEGIVLLEVEVDGSGKITATKVVQASNRFDGVCSDTVRRWELEPARHEGDPVATRAYVVCNFRPPPLPF